MLLALLPALALAQAPTITIRAGTVLDGRGGTLRNTTIVIAGSRIARLDPALTAATYDLSRLTVMPGGIDTHVHLTSHFDANGRPGVAPGADGMKILGSKSSREGGGPTLSEDELRAACGEAKAHGRRCVVHAHAAEAARRAVLAGATSIEHGVLLDEATLDLMADHGTFFDPNLYLVFQNYFDNKARFLGMENYTEEGFAQMHRAVPLVLTVFKQALRRPRLRVVFGTYAVAGAFGKNGE